MRTIKFPMDFLFGEFTELIDIIYRRYKHTDDTSQFLTFPRTKRYFVDKYKLIHFLFETNLCNLMRVEYSVPVPATIRYCFENMHLPTFVEMIDRS